MTIDSWRPGRNENGWKLKSQPKRRVVTMEVEDEDGELVIVDLFGGADDEGNDTPPEMVAPLPHLNSDIVTLLPLTQGNEPAKQKCRVRHRVSALYLMCGASGQGVGSGLWEEQGLWYESASWAAHCQKDYTTLFRSSLS